MKKSLICLVLFLTIVNLALGCSKDDKHIVYEPGVELYVVYSSEIPYEVVSGFADSLNEIRGEEAKVVTANASKQQYEIVLGNTSREISKQAYKELSKVNRESNEYYGYIIYCKDNSIAIAYDVDMFKTNFTINKALSIFISKYATGKSLSLKQGLIEKDSVNIVEEQRLLDEIQRNSDWLKLENQLKEEVGMIQAKSIVYEFKQLYKLIDNDMITWLANLYDVNAGFYYSNSGRDTEGFGSDIESTNQALGILQSSGVLKNYKGSPKDGLPAYMVENIGLWNKSLQNSNGYFYHPQWIRRDAEGNFVYDEKGNLVHEEDYHLSRRGRDLTRAVSNLRMLGYRPTYNTPLGDEGDGNIVNRSSYVNMQPENISETNNLVKTSGVVDHLYNATTFENYLKELDILASNYASYSIGNQLAAQASQIVARDKSIGTSVNPTPLTDVLINWLNDKQDENTGMWIAEGKDVDFDALNGAFKILSVYQTVSRSCPNLSKIVSACKDMLKTENDKSKYKTVVYVYNLLGTINMALENAENFQTVNQDLSSLKQDIKNDTSFYIKKSAEIMKLFIKEDGSCSYSQNKTSSTSQGLPVAIEGTNEGDVNATTINLNGIADYLFKILNVSKVYPFGEAERMQFILVISNLKPIVKKYKQN